MKTIRNKKDKSAFTKKIESVKTDELENYLLTKNTKNIKKVLEEKKNVLTDDEDQKYYENYLKDIIKQKGFTIRKVISLAGMNESYGRQVIGGEKGISKRDTIIRICIAANCSVVETNRVLKLYDMKPLYAKNKRDAVIMISINEGNKFVENVNEILVQNDLEPLKECSKD